MDEKKSYGGLVLWLMGYLALTLACCFLPEKAMLRGVMQVMSLGVAVLIYMIYVNEKVYWINGVTFEEALKATSAQRKAFALRHLKIFLWFAVPYFLFSCASYALEWSPWIDFAIGCVGIIAAALFTIPIHLETKSSDS